jgi:hypothetical protein
MRTAVLWRGLFLLGVVSAAAIGAVGNGFIWP